MNQPFFESLQWGSVADWVSGIGSFAAAVVALYVAHNSSRVRLRGHCGKRIVIGRGQPPVDVFSVHVTNISQRPTVITNVGFTFGFGRWKRNGLITFMPDEFGPGIPKALSDGDTANWSTRLGPDSKWVRELVEKFEVSPWMASTWRLQVHTSNGGTTVLKPEKSMLELLVACAKERAIGHTVEEDPADAG